MLNKYTQLDIFTMLFLGMCPIITLCYLSALLRELSTLVVIATWPGLPVFWVFHYLEAKNSKYIISSINGENIINSYIKVSS